MFTQKQLDAFMRSERAGLDGIGFNDAWNMREYGITRSEANLIRKLVTDRFGMRFNWPKRIKPSDLNQLV